MGLMRRCMTIMHSFMGLMYRCMTIRHDVIGLMYRCMTIRHIVLGLRQNYMESVQYYYGVTVIYTVRYICMQFMYAYTNCEEHFYGVQTQLYEFYSHSSVHRNYTLITLIRSNEIQQYAGVYLLQNFSTLLYMMGAIGTRNM